ncbi:MAG: CotH kinase family protein, partial [Parasporobacterium sp.]|nr:CotH kinase family protein [Parasporobacterium sp.]
MKKTLLSFVLVFLLLIGSISSVLADDGLIGNDPDESKATQEQLSDGDGINDTDIDSMPEMPDADGQDAGDLEDDIMSDEEIIEEEIISEAVDAAGAEIVAEAVAEELSLEAKNAIDSPFDINFIHNGVTYSAFMKADKKYYLFVPNNVSLSDITLNCFGFAPQTVSAGEINKETNQIISPFAVSGDTLSVTTDKGDSYVITVMQSNVPSVEIELSGTDLETINAGSKDTKYKGNRVTVIDEYGNESVNENVTVKGRGNTTWVDSDKKPYQLSFDKKASVLGMEPAKKWILLASAFDDSLMRNQIAFETAAKLGMYGTTEYRFANLWADGEYRGLYLIGEKIEIGKNRLNLTHPQGCVFEMDTAFYGAEAYYFKAGGQMYTVKESVTEEESDIIAAEQNFKDKVNGLLNYIGSSQNISVEELSKYIDVQSFAQLYLMTDYFENAL